MKVLVVCQYYYPEPFRLNEICEELVSHGHDVLVLTGIPNYPSGVVPREYKHGGRRMETIGGVEVCRCFEIPRRSSTLGLAANYVSYMLSASVQALKLPRDFDVVLVYQLSPVTMALPAVLAKNRSSATMLLYCLDIWPESMKNLVTSERHPLFVVMRRFSQYVYSACDAIAVSSEAFAEYLQREHSIDRRIVTYIPQFAEDMGVAESSEPGFGDVNFVFTGNIGIAQDVDCILDAVKRVRDVSGVKVHLVGDGSQLARAKDVVRREGLSHIVVFHGRHAVESMPQFYALADACLLTLRNDSLVGMTVPGKLQGYMAAGLPVIGAVDGAAATLIDAAQCGATVPAGDSEGLAGLMRDFINHPESFAHCGQNGRAYYEANFTKARFMQGLEQLMHDITGQIRQRQVEPSMDRPRGRKRL